MTKKITPGYIVWDHGDAKEYPVTEWHIPVPYTEKERDPEPASDGHGCAVTQRYPNTTNKHIGAPSHYFVATYAPKSFHVDGQCTESGALFELARAIRKDAELIERLAARLEREGK